MNINNADMTMEFKHLGIRCVRRKDIGEALEQRRDIRVDPYRQGFGHAESLDSIDLSAVKLCFQLSFASFVILLIVLHTFHVLGVP